MTSQIARENDETYVRDPSRRAGYPTEAENAGDAITKKTIA